MRTWNEQKVYLCHIVIQLHRIYGAKYEDELEKEFLKGYCKEIIQQYKEDMETAIVCFESLIQQAKDCGWIKYDYNASARFMETDRRRPLMK